MTDEALRAAIKKRRRLIRRHALPPWTHVDPLLTRVLIASDTPAPPLWIGKLWLRWIQTLDHFGQTIFVRLLIATASAVVAFSIFVGVAEQSGWLAGVTEAVARGRAMQIAIGVAVIVFALEFALAMLWSKKIGAWYDREFVFDTPVQVLAVRVKPQDNDKAFIVHAPMALPGSFAKFQTMIDRDDGRVRADLRTGPGAPSLNFSKSRTTGIKLSERVPVYLVAETAPEATPTMIRVVLKSIRYDGKAATSTIEDL